VGASANASLQNSSCSGVMRPLVMAPYGEVESNDTITAPSTRVIPLSSSEIYSR
jgi:hypothetical protein